MNKVILYSILIVTYLVLSKTFSPDNSGIEYIRRSRDLAQIIQRAPAEAILLHTQSKGFLIKTYYQRYKIIYGFHPPREIVVRTKRSFAEYSKKFVGMSLFRKRSGGVIETTAMPPGSLFIGNRQFGRWVFLEDDYSWSFYRAYKNFPKLFGWYDFKPSRKFFKKLLDYEKKGVPFHGEDNDFGQNGKVTSQFIKAPSSKEGLNAMRFKTLFNEYLKLNYTY